VALGDLVQGPRATPLLGDSDTAIEIVRDTAVDGGDSVVRHVAGNFVEVASGLLKSSDLVHVHRCQLPSFPLALAAAVREEPISAYSSSGP
jgi:hypothetical protein